MLKRLTPRDLLDQLAETWEKDVRAAWIAALDKIAARVTSKVFVRIVKMLERHEIQSAIAELGVDEGVFARFEQALVQAYHSGGIATVDAMPVLREPDGAAVHFSWGVRNLPAEQAMRNHAAALVRGATAEMVEGMREVLTDNLSRGQNPRDAGTMLAGKVNRATGKREGGLIGLAPRDMKTVAWIEQGLAEGDPERMRQYLGLTRNNKTIAKTVMKALNEGKAIPSDTAKRAALLYANRALKDRADTIAQAETNTALETAKRDAYRQQIDAGKLAAQDVTKKWKRTVSREPRIEHLMMAKQEAIPFDQMFVLPDGIQCTGPHDPNLPAKHRVNCKCGTEYSIDFTGQALRRYRERAGG